ncbi:hypothetical protein ABFA07_015762 [Porites harrisoni]
MPGYSLAAVDQSRIDEKSLCPKCKGLLKEAVQTIQCGHRYCKTCVDILLNHEDGKCVIDGSDIIREQVFLDRFIEREVQSMLVHCVHHDQGCDWKDELKKREDHEAVCAYVQVPCVHSKCGELVTRSNLVEHLEYSCKFRTEKCEYCHALVEVAFMEGHQESHCPSVPTVCPECGRKAIPRAQIAAHIDPVNGDCEGVLSYCLWTQIGCSETKTMKLQERKIHEEKHTSVHLMLLFQTVMQLISIVGRNVRESGHLSLNEANLPTQKELEQFSKQVENALKENDELKSKVVEQEQRIQQLESARQNGPLPGSAAAAAFDLPLGEDLLKRINTEEAKTADLEVLFVESNKLNEELQRQVSSIARRQEYSNGTVDRLHRQFESMSHSLALRNVMMTDLDEHVREQQVSSHDGVLVWKISDFAKRRQNAVTGNETSFYSPCFFTSRYGYKMCARVYLNGDGIGKGTHISVFFVVMRGEYDALLRGPFRQKVTFILLDQNNVEHVIDSFRPDPNSSSFQRPRRETNIASGCPTFCSLSEVNNHAYIRDDVMFLKVIVDTTDL